MYRKTCYWLLLLILGCLVQGCFIIPHLFQPPVTGDWNNQPDSQPFFNTHRIGKKKRRNKLHAPIPLVVEMRNFRMEQHTFPLTLAEFKNYSPKAREAMKMLKEAGYTDLKIGYWALDSFRLTWKHPYIEDQYIPPGKVNVDASGVFIFTYKGSSFEIMKEIE